MFLDIRILRNILVPELFYIFLEIIILKNIPGCFWITILIVVPELF